MSSLTTAIGPGLLDPLKIGSLQLPNRIIMAPLTRCRASEGRVPNVLMAGYYRQRASAGLIISEATAVTPMGVGYPDTPGIWSDEQVEGWKLVTEAVHSEGGRMVLQLWHVGRISDPSYLHGKLPVAPSAIAPEGHVNLLRPKKNYVTPRALELDEIPELIECYRAGAKNAMDAGFDGVEIHGANGYLLNQFLSPTSNRRTDKYGGRVENRARLMLEIVDAVISVWGAERVGLHLSPGDHSYSVANSESKSTYDYVVQQLNLRGLAFICVRESLDACIRSSPGLRKLFQGIFIANDGFSQKAAEEVLARREADAVAFGRPFIANPDLVCRFALGAQLNVPDPKTFYAALRDLGYTDYPTLRTIGG
jgi:2,4-dienoyl-CoA reductase-like NADH-dependent reductase (Old Yellow Enzyme family)